MFEDNTLFYNGNQKLKKAGVALTLNVFQQQEFVRCMFDPLYFIKTYVMTVSLDYGLVPFALYPYQEKMVSHMADNRFSIFLTARQMGKCVSSDVNIRVRNKKTGKTHDTTIGDFYEMQRANGVADLDEKEIVEPVAPERRNRTLHLGLAEICELWYPRPNAG